MAAAGDFIMLFCSAFVCIVSVIAAQMTSVDDVLKPMHLEVDKDCIRNKIGYSEAKYHFNNCINDIQWRLRENILRGESVETITEVFCDKKGDPFCSDVVLAKLGNCLTDDQREFVKYQTNAEDAILNYACAKDAKLIKDFSNVNFTTCSDDAIKNQVAQCLVTLSSISEVKMKDFYKEETCDKRQNLAQCWADTFKSCEDETAFLFTRKSEFIALNATPCVEFLNAETTTQINGGTISTINLNLVLISLYLVYSRSLNVI